MSRKYFAGYCVVLTLLYIGIRKCKDTEIKTGAVNTTIYKHVKYVKDFDFSWIKYGVEDSDWALAVNTFLCVERDRRDQMKLVAYSSQKYQLDKVRQFILLHLC